MKFRSSFVTNSSSSSFVIAYKGATVIDDETMLKYPFLKHQQYLIKRLLGDEIKDLEDYFEWRDDDDPIVEKCKDLIMSEYSIFSKYIDNNDELSFELLRSLDDGINFIILEED